MNPASVSIAMATYNGAVHLERQLASLAAQSCPPLELVVNDDRSTDATVDLLRAFAARASFPVRIEVNAERLGWRANFLAASERCIGTLIAFCDQDDDWYPGKLACVTAPFDDPEVLLVFHDADLVDASGVRYGTLWPPRQVTGRIARLSRPTPWSNPLGLTQVFRRSLTRFNDLWADSIDHYAPPHRAAHDQWFYFLATNLGDVIALPERLLGYRQHGANAVGWNETPSSARPVVDEVMRSIGMLTAFVAVLRRAEAREVDVDMRQRLAAAARRNGELLDRLQMRLTLHRTPGIVDRLRAAAALHRRRAYAPPDGWGLGRRALLVDARVGLMGASQE